MAGVNGKEEFVDGTVAIYALKDSSNGNSYTGEGLTDWLSKVAHVVGNKQFFVQVDGHGRIYVNV